MPRENIMDALGDIAREKGIQRTRLVEVIQEAVTAAAKRKFKNFTEIEARINEQSGELEVYRYKIVTENLTDPDNEISIEEARRLDSLAEPGDEVEYEIDNKELSRVIAQTARQMIFQKIREAERETIFENFKDRKGELLNGVVSRTERNRIFVTINQTEAILYRREQIPNERYASGDHIRVMLLDVLNDPKEPSLLVISRADPMLLIKLFEMEVPEIYDGTVEIVDAAREPGRRAKVAVRSNDTDVDPVGACVGMRGARVQSIISELRGEKIDIINWLDDLPTYVANALAPAELSRIRIKEEEGEIDVEVEPDQLSLAIGRQGQNVRLASKLVGYKINVNSTQEKPMSLEEQIRERLLASQAELSGQPLAAVVAASATASAPVTEEAEAAVSEPAPGATAETAAEAVTEAQAEPPQAAAAAGIEEAEDSKSEATAAAAADKTETGPEAEAAVSEPAPGATAETAAEAVTETQAEPPEAPAAAGNEEAEDSESETAPEATAAATADKTETGPEAAANTEAEQAQTEPPQAAAAAGEEDAESTEGAEAEATPEAAAATAADEPETSPEAEPASQSAAEAAPEPAESASAAIAEEAETPPESENTEDSQSRKSGEAAAGGGSESVPPDPES